MPYPPPTKTKLTRNKQTHTHASHWPESTMHAKEHACRTTTFQQQCSVSFASTFDSRCGGVSPYYIVSKPTTRHGHMERPSQLNQESSSFERDRIQSPQALHLRSPPVCNPFLSSSRPLIGILYSTAKPLQSLPSQIRIPSPLRGLRGQSNR